MLLGQYDTETTRIRLRGHHPLRPGIQSCSPHTPFCHSARPRRRPDTHARNTPRATPDGYHTRKVWPGPLSLATTHGISFPAGTEMFHFPAYPPHQGAVTAHDGCRVSPFRNPRIKARSAAPRGISLPATSFIGPVCQGIHHTPLQATPHTGETRKTNEHRTTDHQHSAITKRSNNNQTPNKKGTRSKYISTSRPQPYNNGMVRSRPLSSSQTTTPHHNQPTPHGDSRPRRAPVRRPPSGGRGGQGTQQHAHTRPKKGATTVPRQHARHTQGRPPRHHARHQNDILRRKEVIQPHLPVRLPCYDLVPITSLTLDGSPPRTGQATGFGCCPLS